ncbi:MAG: hypothetical protein EHM70_01610 [Chloroflexota bacterium]|nr:MAG: hypothetical protein EHM70_01610 [Chloroflexota bacterium]
MDIPVTRTKIIVPSRREDILSRRRLLELLDKLLDEKLVIVSAPAGYGKTSLLVDMSLSSEMPFCWYSLDSLDQDPQRFIAHFIAAIALRFPSFGRQSSAALKAASQRADFSLDPLLPVLINEAYECIQEHFALVLDDYHLVHDNLLVNTFVNRFIQEVAENCHIVIISRSLLPLADLDLMVARSLVGGLGLEELSFRSEEIQALMLQNHRMALPNDAAEEMVKESEGWITGLLLSTQMMWQGMGDRLRLARVSGIHLYDYLAHQVFGQQPAHLQDFLLRTSVLEEFDANLCEEVLGEHPPGHLWTEMLDTVRRNNLFALPVGEDGSWIRYHHLFQDFLHQRLEKERPGEATQILHSLAMANTRRGDWDKAYAIYKQLGDDAAIVGLLEQVGTAIVKSGRTQLLVAWLDSLPAALLDSHPVLLAQRGVAVSTLGDRFRGLSLLNLAIDSMRHTGDRSKLAWPLVWRAFVHYNLSDSSASLADAREVIEIYRQEGDFSAVEAEALRIEGLNYMRSGNLADAIASLSASFESFRSQNDDDSMARVSLTLGGAYLDSGDYARSLSCYQSALDYYRLTRNIIALASGLNDLGVLRFLHGEYEQACRHLEEGLVLSRQGGLSRLEALCLTSLGDLYYETDLPDVAIGLYHQAELIAERIGDSFLHFYLALTESSIARKQGDLQRAAHHLGVAEACVHHSKSEIEQGLCWVEAGQVAMAAKDYARAIASMEVAARIFLNGGQRLESGRAYLYLANAHFAAGNFSLTAVNASHALRSATLLENRHFLVSASRMARPMLEMVASDPGVGVYAVRLLDEIARFERDLPALRRRLRRQISAVSLAPPKLRMRALGRSQVILDGKTIRGADWQTQVTRDLFFYLLSSRAPVTKEVLGEIFWPESSPSQLKLRFKNTLYRLRRALQQDVVMFDDDCYSFNRSLDYDFDVETFNGCLEQARKASKPAEQKKALHEAFRLYQGDYLPDVGGAWAIAEREHLQHAYIQAGLELAQAHLDAAECTQALDICNRLLESEPSLEGAHRLAMRCYAALGNRSAIASQYELCVQSLEKEIGVSPSPQTEELYKKLMQ